MKRVDQLPGMDRGGISELGVGETPVGPLAAHHLVQDVMNDVESGAHEYISAAKDAPTDESRWARLEVVWQRGEEVLKTEPTYDDQAYLSKKPRCRH